MVCAAIDELLRGISAARANAQPAHSTRNGSAAFVGHLLGFYWNFQGHALGEPYILCIAKKEAGTQTDKSFFSSLFTAQRNYYAETTNYAQSFAVSEAAVHALMRFVCEASAELMNEVIWSQVLRTLNAIDSPFERQDTLKDQQKSWRFHQWIELSPYFAPLIKRSLALRKVRKRQFFMLLGLLDSSLGRLNSISSMVSKQAQTLVVI